MFQQLKEQVPLLDAISRYTSQELVHAGGNTLQLEDRSCPFCGHFDCFKVKTDGEVGIGFKCFSCGKGGSDAVAFLADLKKLRPFDAGKEIAKDYNIPIDFDVSIAQRIFDMASRYFHNVLKESTDTVIHDGQQYTPLEYQLKVRKHTMEAIERFQVGWNDGNLVDFLRGFDFEDADIVACGLGVEDKRRKGVIRSYMAKGCFIYPHFVKGWPSHFTQKDPHKVIKGYQLKKEHQLNGYIFYGQDDLEAIKEGPVFIVEGENDRISLWEYLEGAAPILGTIGTLSLPQKQWLAAHAKDRKWITVFDNDDAGMKYRMDIWKLDHPDTYQYRAPDPFKDVDEYLKKDESPSIDHLVQEFDPRKAPIEGAAVIDGMEVFELEGEYCRTKIVGQQGERKLVRLSNFTIQLRNIFLRGDGERTREIVIVRRDGAKSSPMLVTSEMKVSLKAFKEAVANAIDATFYGGEMDLMEMWDYVYAKGCDRLVHIPSEIGHLQEDRGGWLFRDCYVTANGSVISPDKEGVMWVNGNSTGVKPMSVQLKRKANSSTTLDIPGLMTGLSSEERRAFRVEFYKQFCRNIGDVGLAVAMLAWSKANAFSHRIFSRYKFFPFLYIWGRHGKGKTSVTKWLLNLYGMADAGATTIGQLGSGAGFSRMMAYFSSLPLLVDEMRADRVAQEFYGVFRAWYNRQSRNMGSREDSTQIVTQEIKSNLIFCGQDIFTDPATRSRCIEIEMPGAGRELQKSYVWIETNQEYLRSIGFSWVLEAMNNDDLKMFQRMFDIEKEIMERSTCDNRVAKQWSIIGYFSEGILEELNVEFDLMSFLAASCGMRYEQQRQDDIVNRFFSLVEGLQAMERTEICGDHIRVEGEIVHVWIMELLRICRSHRSGSEGEAFTKNAIHSALRDEDYYVGTSTKPMGRFNVQRRVVSLHYTKGPEALKNIAEYAKLTTG